MIARYINPKLIAVLCLGFSAGLPLALIGSTLQAWFTQSQTPLIAIGTLSLLGLPYALKFLWAPLLDHYAPPFLGKRRGWIICFQFVLSLLLMLIAQLSPLHETLQIGILAFLIAFFSASQDIAIDAYRTDILSNEEKGLGAAYYIFTYRLASLISGGLALVLADYVGWRHTYQYMALLMLFAMFATFKAPAVLELKPAAALFQTIIAAFRDLLQREQIILLCLFIIFYKFGDALALQLMTNFLLHGLHFSLTEVGLAYKTVGLIAMISGAFVGGSLLLRLSIYKALLLFGLAQTFSNLTFVILALVNKNFILMAATIFIENFCSGLSTAAFLAFLMMLCHPLYTASQYALLSAIASFGRVFLGPLAAWLVDQVGWASFYFTAFLLCFPGIFLLLLLKNKVSYAHAMD